MEPIYLLMIPAIFLYLAPSIIAFTRHRRNRIPISLLNIVFGWTAAGWIASLIWACYIDESDDWKERLNG